MTIANSVGHLSHGRPQRSRLVAKFTALTSLVLLQGCTVNTPSCDGRFEPINRPAPVSMDVEADEAAANRDQTS